MFNKKFEALDFIDGCINDIGKIKQYDFRSSEYWHTVLNYIKDLIEEDINED